MRRLTLAEKAWKTSVRRKWTRKNTTRWFYLQTFSSVSVYWFREGHLSGHNCLSLDSHCYFVKIWNKLCFKMYWKLQWYYWFICVCWLSHFILFSLIKRRQRVQVMFYWSMWRAGGKLSLSPMLSSLTTWAARNVRNRASYRSLSLTRPMSIRPSHRHGACLSTQPFKSKMAYWSALLVMYRSSSSRSHMFHFSANHWPVDSIGICVSSL